MTPYYEDADVTLFLGDCVDVMAQMAPESVSCVSCSPPFYGLRKYTCEPSIWPSEMPGCDDCEHEWGGMLQGGESYRSRIKWQHDVNGPGRVEVPEKCLRDPITRQARPEAWQKQTPQGQFCSLCGAWRGWLGLEPTVEMYVEHTIEWLRAVKRVLRKDGVVWLDIDDSRAATGGPQVKGTKQTEGSQDGAWAGKSRKALQPKSLCLIPQRIAIAAQEDGWIVRSEIIITSWMPESAQDRPTDACRKVLMLTKTNRPNFWWNERTMHSQGKPGPGTKGEEGVDWDWYMKKPRGKELWAAAKRSYWHGDDYWYDGQAVRVRGSDNTHTRAAAGQISAAPCESEAAIEQRGRLGVFTDGRNYDYQPGDLRNLGSVWTDIPPAAYPDAHFATFAVEEPERCILASCPAEICVKCGQARVRVVKTSNPSKWAAGPSLRDVAWEGKTSNPQSVESLHRQPGGVYSTAETKGWTDCGCEEPDYQPGLVLDPFIGTGTTAIAARKLGRRCIGIDASEDYLQQAVTRLSVGDSGIRRLVEARKQGAEQGVLL